MFDKYRIEIENNLKLFLKEDGLSSVLCESMEYGLMDGGKRIRPCLMLCTAEMLGADMEKTLPFACALEMIHSYSLIHDDLPAMDDDDYRRGKLSTHKKYGEANGILAGDALLTEAALLLSKVNGYDAAKTAVFDAALEMVSGQSYDLNESEWSETFLKNLHLQKTGALFKAAVIAGAYVAERPDLVPSFSKLGEAIGLIFQITDDFLDAEKDTDAHKLTFYTFYGREKSLSYLEEQKTTALQILEPFNNEPANELKSMINGLLNRKE